MENNIQTIIDNAKTKYPLNTFSGETLKELEVVLKDSLTLMLDEVRKEAIEQSTGGADRYEIPYITMSKLLNIINSHR